MANRRKNSGSIKYYVAETMTSDDFVYGIKCKIGADTSNALMKQDGVAYNGPLEFRSDDAIAITRQVRQAGVGSTITITSQTGHAKGDTLNFWVGGLAFDGGILRKNFEIVADNTTAAALNDQVFAALKSEGALPGTTNGVGSYTVDEATSTTVTINDNIGGTNAYDKLNGVMEGELEIDCNSNDSSFVIASASGASGITVDNTVPYGNRGNLNRVLDEANFSTGDNYTTVVVDYWDRDADGRARGDVMVRKQAVIFYNESDIAALAALDSAMTYTNSCIDHMIGYTGVGVGAPINLSTSDTVGNLSSADTIPLGATSAIVTPDATDEHVTFPTGNSIGWQCVVHQTHASYDSRIEPPATVAFNDGAVGKYAEMDESDDPAVKLTLISSVLCAVESTGAAAVTIES